MRHFGFILMMLALLLPTVVTAAPGNGNGPGQANGGPAGGGGPAAAPGPQGNGPAGNNGKGPGDDKGPGADPGGPDDPGMPPTAPGATDQNLAQDAFATGTALPLTTIVKAALAAGGGRLIDARLFIINKMPIYRLTLVDNHGVTRRVYYDARTAKPVGRP